MACNPNTERLPDNTCFPNEILKLQWVSLFTLTYYLKVFSRNRHEQFFWRYKPGIPQQHQDGIKKKQRAKGSF